MHVINITECGNKLFYFGLCFKVLGRIRVRGKNKKKKKAQTHFTLPLHFLSMAASMAASMPHWFIGKLRLIARKSTDLTKIFPVYTIKATIGEKLLKNIQHQVMLCYVIATSDVNTQVLQAARGQQPDPDQRLATHKQGRDDIWRDDTGEKERVLLSKRCSETTSCL